jgi:stage II sporulation protein D
MVPVWMETGEVRLMALETYLVGVLLGEMPADFETEALKAQAVVARTYTLRRMEQGDRHRGAAVCADPGCCQAYVAAESYLQQGGSAGSVGKITAAVKATEGIVVTYGGRLIEATYFSCSGGRTEDAAAVWGGEIPYLQAVDSPGEEQAGPFYASVYFTKAEFADALGRTLYGTPDQWLGAVTYTEGGGVASATVAGLRYSGVQLRQLLGLNSTRFHMIPGEAGITVETTGHGHRVGMSQYGADAMAREGNDYTQILHHYYQGVVIDKIGTIE